MKVKLVTAGLCLALAAAAALAAVDARSWRDAAGRADGSSPATRFPGDPVGAFLTLDDDLAFRRAVRAYVAAEYIPYGINEDDSREAARARSAAALAAVADRGEPRLASRAHDLLGVLAANDFSVDQALERFRSAIVADPTNVNAKRNLETLLRAIAAVSIRIPPGGFGPPGGSRGAAYSPPGTGY